MAGDDELTADEIEAARVAAEAATAAANGRTNEGDTEGDTESDKNGKKAAGWKSTADSPSETSGSPPTDWASSLASFLRITQDDANRQAAKAIPNLEALLQGTPHLRGMCHDLHPEDSLVKEVHSGSLTNSRPDRIRHVLALPIKRFLRPNEDAGLMSNVFKALLRWSTTVVLISNHKAESDSELGMVDIGPLLAHLLNCAQATSRKAFGPNSRASGPQGAAEYHKLVQEKIVDLLRQGKPMATVLPKFAKYHDDLSIRASETAAENRSKPQPTSRSSTHAEAKRQGQKGRRKGEGRRDAPNKKARNGDKGTGTESTSSSKTTAQK
ncbi:hypothetical protein FOZ62_022760 [Perkinsus olseni]|uniref:Uncharacterized protein n=1 Tax=Perkinsus olseni TaxID=32597 RepID=A0A7J6RCE9_PEROL|nr:hypothetical protein FOZ62_022760 [Perkinsus olseni]